MKSSFRGRPSTQFGPRSQCFLSQRPNYHIEEVEKPPNFNFYQPPERFCGPYQPSVQSAPQNPPRPNFFQNDASRSLAPQIFCDPMQPPENFSSNSRELRQERTQILDSEKSFGLMDRLKKSLEASFILEKNQQVWKYININSSRILSFRKLILWTF